MILFINNRRQKCGFYNEQCLFSDKPSKPGTPETLRVMDDSVTIHWKAPEEDGGRVIIKYIVEYM